MAKQEKSPRTRLPAGLKAAFAVLAIGAAALFGACENETAPETRQTVFQLDYGVILEDQTGGALTGEHIILMNEIIESLIHRDALISKGLKIIVTSGSSVSRNGGTISVGIENFASLADLQSALEAPLTDMLGE
jgi:hypothetical protein